MDFFTASSCHAVTIMTALAMRERLPAVLRSAQADAPADPGPAWVKGSPYFPAFTRRYPRTNIPVNLLLKPRWSADAKPRQGRQTVAHRVSDGTPAPKITQPR